MQSERNSHTTWRVGLGGGWALAVASLLALAPRPAAAGGGDPEPQVSGIGVSTASDRTPEAPLHVVGARPATRERVAAAVLPTAWVPSSPTVSASPRCPVHDLELARRLFHNADRDRDGAISVREARRSGIGHREFRAFDLDRREGLSSDEFVAGYRRLAAAAGRAIAGDLQAEATRLEALRQGTGPGLLGLSGPR